MDIASYPLFHVFNIALKRYDTFFFFVFSGKFPLESLMTKAEREQFLPAVRSFIKLLRKDVLNPTETKQLLDQARKLDSWNLFPFDVRGNNEPRKKVASGTTFNMGALSGLIRGLVNAQNSGSFV